MIPWLIAAFVRVCVGITAMHVLAALLRGRGAYISTTVGIALHVPLLLLMLALSFPMDTAALVWLLSLLIYTASMTLARTLRVRADSRREEGEV